MRMLSKALTAAAATATLVGVVAGPALADPPSGTTPRVTDVVSVGAQTTEYLFDQFAHDYNGAHKGGNPLT